MHADLSGEEDGHEGGLQFAKACFHLHLAIETIVEVVEHVSDVLLFVWRR
jgi:hypothetical protein